MTFKNKHLSYSRLSRFEQCPLSFKLHYIEKKRSEPNDALRFGKAVHAVLEVLVREHMDQERTGVLSEDRATELWQKAFSAEGMSGMELFQEGLSIIKSFIKDQGIVDHQDVLSIEREFRLPVGPFTVLGYIDRVDRVDDETVEVIPQMLRRLERLEIRLKLMEEEQKDGIDITRFFQSSDAEPPYNLDQDN